MANNPETVRQVLAELENVNAGADLHGIRAVDVVGSLETVTSDIRDADNRLVAAECAMDVVYSDYGYAGQRTLGEVTAVGGEISRFSSRLASLATRLAEISAQAQPTTDEKGLAAGHVTSAANYVSIAIAVATSAKESNTAALAAVRQSATSAEDATRTIQGMPDCTDAVQSKASAMQGSADAAVQTAQLATDCIETTNLRLGSAGKELAGLAEKISGLDAVNVSEVAAQAPPILALAEALGCIAAALTQITDRASRQHEQVLDTMDAIGQAMANAHVAIDIAATTARNARRHTGDTVHQLNHTHRVTDEVADRLRAL